MSSNVMLTIMDVTTDKLTCTATVSTNNFNPQLTASANGEKYQNQAQPNRESDVQDKTSRAELKSLIAEHVKTRKRKRDIGQAQPDPDNDKRIKIVEIIK